MKTIDAMGLACPRPVILSKKLISEESPEEFEVKVDNFIATENLAKMAHEMGYKTEMTEHSKESYTVVFKKDPSIEIKHEDGPHYSNEYMVVISSEMMGGGDEDFAKKLLEGFIYALSEQEVAPKVIVFYNGGVHIPTLWENSIKDLKFIESRGTEIFSCGLCLEHYGLKEKVQVGSITNMYKIVELMGKYKVVKP
ncbi:MAG: sulfurtransferase-like selenium metabolism protein YedF [Peptoniphilus duerdenii]|uniref:sulfurtransferase-like selenium metabolism protein YedF n=1 Tax=Peptoniphilus duerdenii TaxID=507750 RepID=UPI0023F31970|nr:sulfurtransferase-like selenium metabolism protein YedF [Peptoniphilus duerdenii]MDK8276306.1 sulfurtransferase-like selenium metabolism protein YedF [Peptoniphilus duerdenii]